ncbi:uncharacterized protein LOC113278564 isoform X2 [Papaver somniferum]|uniref:uncharacterized protein LOC113278564 isoform X2 n=1 Tax=Papaver somniferum TaxID=3469 RepID=UPI000E6F5C84|nr:uncharacterized protein LOC113278564 isoform X2 [Papaver somniferum]
MDYKSFIGGGGSISDNEDMIRDIVSRLPVKSLMRFKSVCKHFQYLIEEDEYLIDLHYKQSKTRPGLIIIVPRFYLATPMNDRDPYSLIPVSRYYALSKEISFLSADIVLGENGNATAAIVHTFRNAKDDTFKCTQTSYWRDYRIQYNQILKPVNGLICFVYWSLMYMSTVTFFLYNVSTREIMIVRNSAFYRGTRRDKQYESCRIVCTSFELGFDPVTKEYKLIAVFTVRKDKLWSGSAAYTVCEALTLGNNTWRNGVQLCNFPSSSFSVNGSIYWHCTTKLSHIKHSDGFEWYKDEECPSIVSGI